MKKRSLYQCYEAKVLGDRVYCKCGYRLGVKQQSINVERLARGDALQLPCCQDCADYNEMGDPIKPNERGWIVEA